MSQDELELEQALQLARAGPKVELHLHIEGTLEPELVFKLAQKHGIQLGYNSVEDLRQAYDFKDLQSFLDVYYVGTQVLKDEDDFYELMRQYLVRCRSENIVHAD